MKTVKFLVFMALLTVSNSYGQTASSPALQDGALIQKIIATYPSIDINQDSDISVYEAQTYAFPNGVFELVFNTYTYNTGFDFTGFNNFGFGTLRLSAAYGYSYQGYNLDLSTLGTRGGNNSTLPGSIDRVEELTLDGIYFSNLDFANLREIHVLNIRNGGTSMNLENLHLLNKGLYQLEISNSSQLLTLDLSAFLGLDQVVLTNDYIENLYLGGTLRHLHIENIDQLKALVLPATNYGSAYLENLEIIGSLKPLLLTGLDLSKETNLKNLYLETDEANSKITSLDLSKNTKLIRLTVINFDGLTALNFSTNTLLTEITVKNQANISDLDFSNNTALTNLTLTSNPNLTTIDVSKNTALTSITLEDNNLSGLDLSGTTSLTFLSCYMNNLTTLDLSNNTLLERLDTSSNKIKHLNVTLNSNLSYINVNSNELLSLNIANGNNANMNTPDLTGLFCGNNPNLTCIYVDSNVLTAIPIGWYKDGTSNYAVDDEITINDANFKTALLNNATTIDIDGNSKISTCEAENFKGTIDVSNKNITDITGIENFPNATVLKCSNNNIGSLDLLKLPSLTELYCDNNQITVLDPSASTNLTKIYTNNNKISSLDLSNNINLVEINCSFNTLTLLNTASNPELLTLVCTDNQLQKVDVSSNPKLITLHCQNNPFTSLSVVETTIDLSNNTDLLHLNCSNTQITYLDVSKQTSLIELFAKSNALSRINMANGNNINMTWMDVSSNPRLFCVQVDSNVANAIPTNWTYDSTTSFSTTLCPLTNCSTVNIPDANFPNALLTYNSLIDTNTDNQISTCEAEVYTGDLDVSDKNITDLTGLEAFINTTGIICNNNNITILDLSHNTKVTKFETRNNQNFAVLILPGGYNIPSSKNSSNKTNANISLQTLDVQNNALTSLDLSNYTALTMVKVNNNNLTMLNLQNGNNSNIIGANFDASGNPGLSTIIVDDITYATTNWTNTDNTATFSTDATLGVNTFLISQFSIYPNPVNSRLNIAYPNDITVYKLRLYNVSGKMVKSFNPKLKQLFLYEMPTGVYFINAKTDKGLISKKLIKL